MTGNEGWIREIAEAYRRGEAIRRELPGGGELVVERPLPFLVVQRTPATSPDEATLRLARAEAAHLVWREDGDAPPSGDGAASEAGRAASSSAGPGALQTLVRAIAEAAVERHGAFLLLELWPGEGRAFRIRAPEEEAPAPIRALADELRQLWDLDRSLAVEILPTERRWPPDREPLLTVTECYRLGVLMLGLELPPVYLQPSGGAFPLYFRRFGQGISRALRRSAFEFARLQGDTRHGDWRELGPREVDPLVWEADRELAEIGGSFDFLLLTSPVNESEEWDRFAASSFERAPEFRYRLLPLDPDLVKRRLYAIELEKIDDPALALLLRDRRDELDRELSLLGERGTAGFLYGSIRLYRPVEDELIELAESLLATFPPTPPVPPERRVGASDFVARAEEEFAAYRDVDPAFAAEVQIRPDVSGAMVSGGNLLVDERLSVERVRLEALVQHEVGTHLLTFHNGSAQPLRQLARGLAGYDETQEALGVFAEYLAGGLTARRMRVLAGRVVAAHAVERGADFLDTFRPLVRDHGFSAEEGFSLAARAHHSGGLTRDAIYLRGFVHLLQHLARGGELEPLYLGKVALASLETVLELRDRDILRAPVLLPRVLVTPDAERRLEAARRGVKLVETVCADGDAGAAR